MLKHLICKIKDKMNKEINLLSTDEYLIRYIFSFTTEEKYRLKVSQVSKLWRKNIYYYNPAFSYAVYLCKTTVPKSDYYSKVDFHENHLFKANELKNICKDIILSSPNYDPVNCCKNSFYISNIEHIKFNFEQISEDKIKDIKEFCTTYYLISIRNHITHEKLMTILEFIKENSLLNFISGIGMHDMCGRNNLDLIKYICENFNFYPDSHETFHINNRSSWFILKYILDKYKLKDYGIKMAIEVCLEKGWDLNLKVLFQYLVQSKNEQWVTDFALDERKYFTLACENGFLGCIKVLLRYYNYNIYPGLYRATWKGHMNIVKYLIECGADNTVKYYKLRRIALKYQHHELYDYLISLN